jgi:type II secretory pathway component PulM
MKARMAGLFGALASRTQVAAHPWRARWQTLDPRVQRFARIGGGLLLLALLWAYAWLPASQGRARLAQRLPQMQAQLVTMQLQAEEVRRINSLPPVTSSRAALPLADVAALQAAFGKAATISVDDSRALRVRIPSIAYTAWLDQLDSVLSRYRLRVAGLTLTTLAASAAAPPKLGTTAPANAAMVAVDLNLVEDRGP